MLCQILLKSWKWEEIRMQNLANGGTSVSIPASWVEFFSGTPMCRF